MKFTKYEMARIVGARALQLSMGAPLLVKRKKDEFSAIKLAQREFNSNVLPITVIRPKPEKLETE